MDLLFCSDIHGNINHYEKIFKKALECNALVIGGDMISPKGNSESIEEQSKFLETYLIPSLENLKQERPNLKIFIMFGNNDCASNYAYVKQNANRGIFQLLESEPLSLSYAYDIIGYPYVPITPFEIKDWEKWDLADPTSRKLIETEKEILLEGLKTEGHEYKRKIFNIDEQDSIENDMELLFARTKPERTICVFHAPPYNTNLDVMYTEEHIGSLSIRMAIEKHQPYFTLHGHIHETVDKSGKYADKIKDTLCYSAGNHFTEKKPHVLIVNLESRSAQRIMLD